MAQGSLFQFSTVITWNQNGFNYDHMSYAMFYLGDAKGKVVKLIFFFVQPTCHWTNMIYNKSIFLDLEAQFFLGRTGI